MWSNTRNTNIWPMRSSGSLTNSFPGTVMSRKVLPLRFTASTVPGNEFVKLPDERHDAVRADVADTAVHRDQPALDGAQRPMRRVRDQRFALDRHQTILDADFGAAIGDLQCRDLAAPDHPSTAQEVRFVRD